MWRCALALALGLGCGRLGFDVSGAHGVDGPLDSTGDGLADGASASSLVAWWPMATDPDLGVVDATGNGHTGTCAGPCPTVTTGVDGSGSAYLFDGTEIIDVADAADLQTPDAFTIAAWLDIANTPSGAECATTKPLGSGFLNSWALCVQPSFEVFFFTSQLATGGQDMESGSGALAIGVWTHVAVRWDGSDKAIFVDGANAGTLSSPGIDFDTGGVVLGADRDSGSAVSFWTGGLADVRVYSSALSDAEIAVLAQP